ncbi:outer membrane beta-barrel protein [Helicobacter sp. 11S02596-1]|uniref:outer membrane beta-barrel protein n=1 Tax=Helicobacter sp. 11S02596-1 TaxID=1476194 RepID=UPI000BA63B5E|nr:outer membrane beta-barrel protein [Helicobacter sp. 11S02596-1]PAF45087.1 hypothetical protein BJI48_00520 [Helicobacter sp. 11S02596-1]
MDKIKFLIITLSFATLGFASDLRLFVGVDTRGTDSIYSSKLYEAGVGYVDEKRYGYAGYLGGDIGVEYFFSQKNAIRASLGLGYSNIKLLNSLNKFDLFSGVASRIGVDYLFNYYSDGKFDFGFFSGLAYFNSYHRRKNENIISNQLLFNLGLNITINGRHRLETGLGIPFFSKGKYDSDQYKNIPITRQFNNLYYGISYQFLFSI